MTAAADPHVGDQAADDRPVPNELVRRVLHLMPDHRLSGEVSVIPRDSQVSWRFDPWEKAPSGPVFTWTPPPSDLRIVGPALFVAHPTNSVTAASFSASLYDRAAGGSRSLVARGESGSTTDAGAVTIDLGVIDHRLLMGHRLDLVLRALPSAAHTSRQTIRLGGSSGARLDIFTYDCGRAPSTTSPETRTS